MKNLHGLPTAILLAEYNAHSGKPAVAKWKRKVTDLVAALLKMKPDLYMLDTSAPSDRMADFEAPADELSAQAGRPVDHPETPAAMPTKAKGKKAKAKAARVAKAGDIKRGAIREMCEALILEVKGQDPATKKPMGLSYATILERVQRKYPEAATSVNCLRWYATKLNKQTGKDRVIMPLRPKAEKAKAAA